MGIDGAPPANLPTVGADRVDVLFGDVEAAGETPYLLADELAGVRHRIEANSVR